MECGPEEEILSVKATLEKKTGRAPPPRPPPIASVSRLLIWIWELNFLAFSSIDFVGLGTAC